MIDISTVGASVEIESTGLGNKPLSITQFSEEGTPFECPDVDLSDNRKNLNGQMISSRTPSVYTVSLTVVPGSKEDAALSKLAQKSALMPGNVTAIKDLIIKKITLKLPAINESGMGAASRTYVWVNGRIKSAPTGPSSSAEGRMSARTFTFEMEGYDPPDGDGFDLAGKKDNGL
jgi:hypothetical protein